MSKKIKWKTEKNMIPDIITELELLDSKKVQVGVIEGEHQWLAAIHEYGCVVKAKRAQYLTVPVNPKAKGKKAADFNNLFVYTSDSSEKFLARETSGNRLEILYWLTKSVKIPERAFLRNGHDDVINDVMKYSDNLLKQVAVGKMTAENYLDALGQTLSTKIKTYARNLDNPSNSWATKEAKGTDNPLVDTGNMINSITWRVK